MAKLLLELLIYAIHLLYHLNSNFYICFVSKINHNMHKDTESALHTQQWSSRDSFILTTIDSVLPCRKNKTDRHRFLPLSASYACRASIGTRSWSCGTLCLSVRGNMVFCWHLVPTIKQPGRFQIRCQRNHASFLSNCRHSLQRPHLYSAKSWAEYRADNFFNLR